ncbi:methyl-accepting chemotaxis protein [Methylophaga sp. OBS4]|uniref:methyl-accepting chemotaxis protein n=1 Tax=Methylophaga sp. OBS4 TaxID=2991935 RepID=UPI002254B10D|nr:methyl-accepting chemotaxis protein [Methylophaga sp. OBS4]MCX4187704.1 methyl-accepting chemotaxis protein [Methylophaga sp. OBS4]
MSLAVSLMNKLSYPKKMAVIAVIFLVPLTITFLLLVGSLSTGITAGKQEQKGLRYINEVRQLYQHLPQHRGMTNTYRNGNTTFESKIMAKRQEIAADIAGIDAVNAELGAEFNTDALWADIKNEWAQVEKRAFSAPSKQVFQEHTQLIAKVYALFERISNKSGLILDPSLNTTFIIEALVYKIPHVTENLGQARGLGSGLAAKHDIDITERVQLGSLLGRIENDFDAANEALSFSLQENEGLNEKLSKYIDNSVTAHDAFSTIINRDILLSDYIQADAAKVFDLGTQAIAANYQLFDTLVPVLDELLQNRIDDLRSQRMLLILIIIAALSVSLYLFAGFYRATINVIQRLVKATDQIADGDLTIEVEVEAQDETRQIVDALNKMTKHLNKVVHQLRNNASLLATASEELSSTTTQAKTNSLEQRSQSEQIATAMNEMSSTVKEIARNAELLAAEVKNANTDSQSGQAVINDTIRSINKLAEGVGNAANVIQELTQSSNEIGSVLTVIKGVAEQTNLLALNAAIEAARAGEHGRGFAVVADEVRTLATRTQDSAEQIQVMVDNLQQNTRQAAAVMAEERENAQNMSHYTKSATQSMQNIVNSMTQIADMSTHVASAAEEQGLVSEEINRNVTYVSDLSSENLNGSEQISIASHELAKLASDLDIIVQRFKV